MGLWGDIKQQTGYDRETSPEKRAAIREQYLQRAQEMGYDRDKADAVLENEGVYAAEKSRQQESADHAAKVAQAHDPAWREKMDQKVQASLDPLDVAEEAYRAKLKGEAPPAPLKYRVPDDQLTDKELVDRYMAAKPTGDPEKDAQLASDRATSPFYSGMRNSLFRTAGIPDLPKDQQIIVQNALAGASQKLIDERKDMGFLDKTASKAAEIAGDMAASPTTYVAPLLPTSEILPVMTEAAPYAAHLAVAGARGVLGSPGLMFGAMSGAEGAVSAKNLGNEDVSVAKEAAKGALFGHLGGMAGKAAGEAAGGAVAKVAPVAAPTASLAANAAGYGAVQSGVELGSALKDKVQGTDTRGVGEIMSDVLSGYGANILTAMPQSVLAQRVGAVNEAAMRKDFARAMEIRDKTLSETIDRINTRFAADEHVEPYAPRQLTLDGFGEKPVNESKAAFDAERKFDNMDAEADRRRQNSLPMGEKLTNIGIGVGEKVVDSKMRALSFFESVAKKERQNLISQYMAKGMTRREVEDAMNKGILKLPMAEELSERIKALPTEMQTMVHEANLSMAPVYYGMSAGDARRFDRYVMSRNFLSAKSRAEARGEHYKTPIAPEELAAYVRKIEEGPDGAEFAKRASYLYGVSKAIVEHEYKAGILNDDQYNALLGVSDHVGIEHLSPTSKYRGSGDRGKQSVNSSDMFNLLGEGGGRGINTDVGGVMHQRIVRAQLEAYKNKMNQMVLEYASRPPEESNGFRILRDGEDHAPGEATISIRHKGETIRVAAPDWLKRSLEQDPEASMAMINIMGFITMSAPVKKFAVQWNPEFAVANVFRDFARYYKLMAAADPKAWGMDNAVQNFLSVNPVTYAKEMMTNIAAVRVDATKKFIHGEQIKAGEPVGRYDGADWYDRALKSNALRGVIAKDTGNPLHTQTKAQKAISGVDKALGYCGEFSENLLRVAAFKTLVDRGFTDHRAGQIVGQFLDYNRQGTMSKLLDRVIPFFNVAIQAPRAEISIARKNPAAFASRLAWSAASYTAIAALAYSLDNGESRKQTAARTRASSLCVPNPMPNKDGSYRMLTVPLDQQDRLLAAFCDSMVRISRGLPIDKERIELAAKDFMSINPDFLSYIPSVDAYNVLFNHTNRDSFFGGQITYAKDGFTKNGQEGTWHLAYDPTESSEAAIKLAQAIYPLVDWQPAALEYAVQKLLPSTFFTKTAKTAYYGVADQDKLSLKTTPMISRLVRDSDPKMPLRDAAAEGQMIKSENDLERYHEIRIENKVKDPDEYMDMMLQKIDAAPDSEKLQLKERLLSGYKDRIAGVDSQTKFLTTQTDPSTWEELDKLHPFVENPRIAKKYLKYKAVRNADNEQ